VDRAPWDSSVGSAPWDSSVGRAPHYALPVLLFCKLSLMLGRMFDGMVDAENQIKLKLITSSSAFH